MSDKRNYNAGSLTTPVIVFPEDDRYKSLSPLRLKSLTSQEQQPMRLLP